MSKEKKLPKVEVTKSQIELDIEAIKEDLNTLAAQVYCPKLLKINQGS